MLKLSPQRSLGCYWSSAVGYKQMNSDATANRSEAMAEESANLAPLSTGMSGKLAPMDSDIKTERLSADLQNLAAAIPSNSSAIASPASTAEKSPITTVRRRVLYDSYAARVPYPLHVGTPSKAMLHRFAQLMSHSSSRRISAEILTDDPLGGLFQYNSPLGDELFLDALVGFLGREYGEPIRRESLAQTSGVTETLPFVLTQMFPNRPTVYVERIAYYSIVEILGAVHFEAQSIPGSDAGIDFEALERLWAEDIGDRRPEDGNYSAILNLVPQFQNPLGSCMSDEQSRRLVELARKFHVLILCDDVYNFHYYSEKPPRRLFAFDNPNDVDYNGGHVVSLGSFSKIFSPALRLGWIEAPARVLAKCGEGAITCSGGALNSWLGGMLAPLLSAEASHQHVIANRELAKRNLRTALEILDTELPSECSIPIRPNGGYFLFIRLPMTVNSTEAAQRLRERHGIAVNDMRTAWTAASTHPDYWRCNALRIAFTFVEESRLRTALSVLCSELKQMLGECR